MFGRYIYAEFASVGFTARHKKDNSLKSALHVCVTISKPKHNWMCVPVSTECSTVSIWLQRRSPLIFTSFIQTAFRLSAQSIVVTMVLVQVSIHKRGLHPLEACRAWHLHKDGQWFRSVLVWFSDRVRLPKCMASSVPEVSFQVPCRCKAGKVHTRSASSHVVRFVVFLPRRKEWHFATYKMRLSIDLENGLP